MSNYHETAREELKGIHLTRAQRSEAESAYVIALALVEGATVCTRIVRNALKYASSKLRGAVRAIWSRRAEQPSALK